MFALTLIKTEDEGVTAAHIALIQGLLEQYHIPVHTKPPHWFEGRKAVRGWILTKPTPEHMAAMRAVLDPHKVDVICEAESLPKLKLAVFDLESTCIEQESLDELAKHVGQEEAVAAITARAMNGEITMHDSFILRTQMLKGIGEKDIDQVRQNLTGFPHMHTTIRWLQSQGVRCEIVSSGVHIFVEAMAEKFGFDGYTCSELDLEDGVIAGTHGKIITKEGKAERVRELIAEMDIDPRQVLAMGDGANDAVMMEEVGRPFGWKPKPILSAVTPNQFNHSDWRALLYTLA